MRSFISSIFSNIRWRAIFAVALASLSGQLFEKYGNDGYWADILVVVGLVLSLEILFPLYREIKMYESLYGKVDKESKEGK